MKDAGKILDEFKIQYKMTVISAHRTPERLASFMENIHKEYDVIIGGAGGAAHLPGVIASMTHLPVIGIPVNTSTLNGVDSLYSIVQMPKGIVVATVGIGNAFNAGLLAVHILFLKDSSLIEKIQIFRQKQADRVTKRSEDLKRLAGKII